MPRKMPPPEPSAPLRPDAPGAGRAKTRAVRGSGSGGESGAAAAAEALQPPGQSPAAASAKGAAPGTGKPPRPAGRPAKPPAEPLAPAARTSGAKAAPVAAPPAQPVGAPDAAKSPPAGDPLPASAHRTPPTAAGAAPSRRRTAPTAPARSMADEGARANPAPDPQPASPARAGRARAVPAASPAPARAAKAPGRAVAGASPPGSERKARGAGEGPGQGTGKGAGKGTGAAAASETAPRARAAAPAPAGPVRRNKAVANAAAAAQGRTLAQWSAEEIAEAFTRFAAQDPEPRGELDHTDAFTLLVAVVLSAQATDAGVNKATRGLFAAASTPAAMLALGEEGVAAHIRTLGLFRTKAKNVVELARLLLERHAGVVPQERAALEALPGVGRKTANVVLNIAFGAPTIAVDTHLFRVANRTGLSPGATPLAVELGLEARIPDRFKLHAHHWLILHGRYICKATKPACGRCIIADLCRWPDKQF